MKRERDGVRRDTDQMKQENEKLRRDIDSIKMNIIASGQVKTGFAVDKGMQLTADVARLATRLDNNSNQLAIQIK